MENMNAEQLQDAYNTLMPVYMNLTFVLAFSALLFVSSPLLASWFSSGRHGKGWFLGGKHAPKEEEWGLPARQSIMSLTDMQPPAKIRIVGGIQASFRCLYNNTLLRNAPFMNLTIGQVLVCLIYEAIVVVFFILEAGNVVENYKRAGYIAVGQLPAVFFLATKNSPLSIIGKGYEKLNFLHRVAGRMLVLFGTLHGFYYLKGIAYKPDLTDPQIQTGIACISALGLILLTSVSFFRKAFYQIFLVSHIVGWITFIVAINFHVPDVLPYTVVALGVYALDIILRIAKTRIKHATLVPLSGAMTMLQVHGVAEGWRAGQHVWVRVFFGLRTFEHHPFTVANAPSSCSPLPGQHNLTLLAKSTGDWTRALNNSAVAVAKDEEKQAIGLGSTARVSIEGPYGGPMFTDFAESQAVLLFAGGSGITFAASVFEELIHQAIQGESRTRLITIVWSMKAIECVDWYQEMFNALLAIAKARTKLTIRVRLYVTGPSRADYSPITGAVVIPSRPDVPALLGDVVDHVIAANAVKNGGRGGGIVVGTCGPQAVVKAVRSAVARVQRDKAMKVGGIVAHSETFGW